MIHSLEDQRPYLPPARPWFARGLLVGLSLSAALWLLVLLPFL